MMCFSVLQEGGVVGGGGSLYWSSKPALNGLSLHPATVLPVHIVGRTRQAATQTEPTRTEGTADAVCHKDDECGSDLIRIKEWMLLTMMFERFWNTVLACITLGILVWIGFVAACMRGRGQKLEICTHFSTAPTRVVEG